MAPIHAQIQKHIQLNEMHKQQIRREYKIVETSKRKVYKILKCSAHDATVVLNCRKFSFEQMLLLRVWDQFGI